MGGISRTRLITSLRFACLGTLAAMSACGTSPDSADTTARVAAITSQDVMGFEAPAAFTASSGTVASTAMRTQGAAAYALTAPVNFTTLVSQPIDSTTPSLAGLSNAGSSFALDLLLPTQQPNQFFFGSVQLLVSVPSRNVNNLFLSQVELTGLPLGTFQTLRFTITDGLRNALSGATFNDLTFTVALNAPSGATGTYIFDNLRVVAAGNAEFALTANPAAVTVAQGASASSTITVSRLNGFASAVAFTASGLPTGVTAAFNPATTSTTGTTSVLTFTAAANAALGTTAVTVTGTGGGLSRTTTVNLTVAAGANFTIAANPAAVLVAQGGTGTSTVTITRLNGFAAAVAFTASGLPAGVTAAFNPASTAGTTSVVTFTAAANAALGPATVTITGTGGGLTRTTTIALTVVAGPDFALAANPAAVTVVQGATATSTITVTRLNGFAAAVSFTIMGLPAGVTAAFNPASTTGTTSVVTFTAAANAALGSTAVVVTGTGGGLARTTTITLTVVPAPDFALTATPAAVTVVQGATATTTINVARLNGFAPGVALTATGLPAGVTATFNPPTATGASSVLTFTADPAAALGTATVTVTGTGGGLTRTTTVALTVAPAPDFTLGATPAAVTVVQGSSATATIDVTRLNGFAAGVSFIATGVPPGVTVTFNPATTTGASSLVTFTADPAATLGTGPVTIIGLGGGLTRTTTITLTVAPAPDFTLTASPASVTVAIGDVATTTITINPLNGFADSVAFTASGLPAGVTATFTPVATTGPSTLLTFTADNTATPGDSTITVTGTDGALVRTVTVDLTVGVAAGDFALTIVPSGYGVKLGTSLGGTVFIDRVDGFSNSVTFTVSGLPGGVTATFSPGATTSGDSVDWTLAAALDAVVGPATLTVTGTGGGHSHTVSVPLFINPIPTQDFTLAATPAGVTFAQGSSTSVSIAVLGTNGFSQVVSFSASGLPAGVTAAFVPAADAAGTVLTLTAAADAALGAATITVTGQSGALTHTVPIAVVVNAAVPAGP